MAWGWDTAGLSIACARGFLLKRGLKTEEFSDSGTSSKTCCAELRAGWQGRRAHRPTQPAGMAEKASCGLSQGSQGFSVIYTENSTDWDVSVW